MLFTFENNRLVLGEFWSTKEILYNFKAELFVIVKLFVFDKESGVEDIYRVAEHFKYISINVNCIVSYSLCQQNY